MESKGLVLGEVTTDLEGRGHRRRAATTEGGQRFTPTHASWAGGRSLEAELEFQSTLAGLALIDEPEPVIVGHDGRYALRRLIGRGAMGAVYIADDLALRRAVAVKVVSRLVGERHRFQDRLRREAWALALLDHPNVLSIHDVDLAASGELFIVMQYVSGHNLREWSEAVQPSRAQILDVFVAAGRGLAAAHAKGLVHRDFKPDNVMISGDERAPQVLVADFGLAGGAPLRLEEPGVLAPAGQIVTSAGFLGTPAYMPPEQRRSEAVDARSDQYAFCVSLWELLVGERPGPEPGAAPRPSKLPRWLHARLLRGLASDPDDRYPDMATLLDALERPPARRRRLGSLTSAAVLGGVLVWGGLQLRPDPQSSEARVDPCASADRDMDAIWNTTRKGAVEARLAKLELDGAGEVVSGLELAAARWRDDRVGACRQDQPSPCHDRWLRRFDRRVELLSKLDPSDASRVAELLEPLRRGSYCDVVSVALDADVAEQLDRAQIQATFADYEGALELAETAWSSARELGGCTESGDYSHEAGAAGFRLGHIHGERHDADAALEWLGEATLHALACDNDPLLITVKLRQAKIYAVDAHELAAAERSLKEAEAAIASAGELPAWLADEHKLTRGLIELHQRDYERAIETFEEVLSTLDDQPLLALEALINLGIAAKDNGEHEVAWRTNQRALELARNMSSRVPERDIAVLNFGLAQRDAGDLNNAAELLHLVISSPHPSVQLRAYAGLIEVEATRNNYDEARALAPRALDLVREYGDQPADDRAGALFWAGQVMADNGDRRGLEALAEALQIFEKELPDGPERVICEFSLAGNYLGLGDFDRARQHHRHLRSLDPELTEPLGELIEDLGRKLEQKDHRG